MKKLRAYQRSITISIAKSFKTAPTDALLVIANIIPIDLRILQLSTLRFRSDSMKPFVNSSFRWLLKNFPNDSLQLQRAEIVSQYSAFSFAFPGPNLTGLQASNRDLLISIKESSTVFACRDCRSSSGLMMAMAYGLLAAGPNDTPPIELAPLLPSKLFVKRETSAVILKLWNLEWAPELAQAPA